MIVRHKKKGYEIITQHAHGLLAGQIADQLLVDLKNERWVETLTAIIEHDDRQLDYREKSYISKTGIPVDFTQENRTARNSIKRSNRLLEQAKKKSKWVYLLISKHVEFINREEAEKSQILRDFLILEKAVRTDYLKFLKVKEIHLEEIYQILKFCDRCSLILCQDLIPTKQRKLEINHSIQEETYFISKNKSGNIQVEPWCFEQKEFTLSIEKYVLEQASFNSNKDFVDQLLLKNLKLETFYFKR